MGNTRLVFTDKNGSGSIDNSEILNETHYYPFGKAFEGAWYNDAAAGKYRYLYNGKELSEEFDLNFYDYGARWLDVGLRSWWEVDPASEGNRRWSPYTYGNNNPIRFIDPDGRESSAYGGFTSSAELAEQHEAASERFREREQSKTGGDKESENKKSVHSDEIQTTSYDDLRNDPLIGLKALTGLYELIGIGTLYQGLIRPSLVAALKWAVGKAGYKVATKGVSGLLKAGNALDKGGFTAVGRAMQKHGSRTGSVFPKATGNAAAINSQGEAVLNGILTNSNATNAIRHHARFGNVLEYRIPGGQGARFSGDGKTFIGFLE